MTTPDPAILLVEDNDDDVFLTKRALAAAGVTHAVQVVTDGEQAIEFLQAAVNLEDGAASSLPAVVFLDLKLPFKSGHEVLAWIRSQPALESLIVVVLTSSDEVSDLRRAYSLGANSYLVKPLNAAQLRSLADAFGWDWLRGRSTSPSLAEKR